MFPSLDILLTGLGIGLLMAAPVGPVNILCIQRSLSTGFFAGLSAGLGAMLGDGLLALVAAIGLTALDDLIRDARLQIQVIGGLVLILFALGLMTSRQQPSSPRADRAVAHTGWIVPQTFFLTVTNPGAILGMLALFGGAGTALGGLDGTHELVGMLAAVMVGSAVWWTIIAWLASRVGRRLDDRQLLRINRIAGLCLMGFGGALIAHALSLGLGALAGWGP